MADVELLPLPEPLLVRGDIGGLYTGRECQHYARANMEPLISENERLRAEVAEWKRVASAQAELHGEAEARAERLAEVLRVAAGELASIGDAIGHDHPEARRIFTLRANLLSARLAALAQEGRND